MRPIRPVIALTAPGDAPLGAERVTLLEAIGREGSISAAARALGLSYKHAWEGVAALNNLAGRPLVESRKGGAKGGGAALTSAGARFVETFRRLEGETAERLRRIDEEFDDDGARLAARMVRGGFLRTSARNALAGTVAQVSDGPVSVRVTLELAEGVRLTAVITRRSLRELGLFPGRRALALIKAPFVHLGPPAGAAAPPGENRLDGHVASVDRGEGAVEVALDLGGGKTLVAVLPEAEAAGLDLSEGAPLGACIDADHIILAID